ncbi:MAG: Gfo/Idh/MocA family protein [Anaerolineae bacterium]
MLNIGIIGYGGRVSGMAKAMGMYSIPYRVAAITDPRAEQIKSANDPFLADTTFYDSADAMLEAGGLDGVMVGTRCFMHTDMACKVAKYKLPLFLEKPVAITFEQVKRLNDTFVNYPAPTVISFPLRLTIHVQTIKQMIEADTIGTVEHVIGFNDVPYGDVYFYEWYRNFEQVGGLFLQKATHDLDYIGYLLNQKPKQLCAMHSRRVYGGDKPHDLKCVDCEEFETCPESPFNLFRERFQGSQVNMNSKRMCLYSKDIKNEDIDNVIIEYENGVQTSYTQNVFARNAAGRRGARFYGYKGTIFFDWYENVIKVFKHQSPAVETITFTGEMPHFGGDRELCYDFLMAMRDGKQSRSPIEAGIQSALTCLWARESAETRRYCDVVMPS